MVYKKYTVIKYRLKKTMQAEQLPDCDWHMFDSCYQQLKQSLLSFHKINTNCTFPKDTYMTKCRRLVEQGMERERPGLHTDSSHDPAAQHRLQ